MKVDAVSLNVNLVLTKYCETIFSHSSFVQSLAEPVTWILIRRQTYLNTSKHQDKTIIMLIRTNVDPGRESNLK